jgi:hypothetical protein
MTKGEFFQTAKEPREKVKDPYPNLAPLNSVVKPETYDIQPQGKCRIFTLKNLNRYYLNLIQFL